MDHGLDPDEFNAWNDVYYFLLDHADPPGSRTPGADIWWLSAADEASRLCQRWKGQRGQELLRRLLAAVYDYLAKKGENFSDKR